MKNQRLKNYFKSRTAIDWVALTLIALFTVYCISSLIYFALLGRIRDCLMCVAYFLVVPVFFAIENNMHLKYPLFDVIVLVIFTAFCSLGASYNLYTTIPCLDDILHAVWGFLFIVLGISIIKAILGEPQTKKAYIMYIILGFAFCCMTAVIWELFEFTTDQLLPSVDQQEDTIVNYIHSFLLYPEYDHYHTLDIEGIAYTVLYDADGNILYTIEGGYLDTGILDTMRDIIFCVIVSFTVCTALIVERCLNKKWFNKFIIPELIPVKGEEMEYPHKNDVYTKKEVSL